LQSQLDLAMVLEIFSPCQCPKISYFPLQFINIEPQRMYTHSFHLPPTPSPLHLNLKIYWFRKYQFARSIFSFKDRFYLFFKRLHHMINDIVKIIWVAEQVILKRTILGSLWLALLAKNNVEEEERLIFNWRVDMLLVMFEIENFNLIKRIS